MCNTLNIKALELYCNIKKWNIELDTLIFYTSPRQWGLRGYLLLAKVE